MYPEDAVAVLCYYYGFPIRSDSLHLSFEKLFS